VKTIFKKCAYPIAALACLCLLVSAGGCGVAGVTDGHLHATALTVFKEPKLGPFVWYHHTKDETAFFASLSYDGKPTATLTEVGTVLAAAAKIITLIP
jgi:hypothetical protein